jgi:hypothetical protein
MLRRRARRRKSIQRRRAAWELRFWVADQALTLLSRLSWVVLRVAVVIWLVLALLVSHPADRASAGPVKAAACNSSRLARAAEELLGPLAER